MTALKWSRHPYIPLTDRTLKTPRMQLKAGPICLSRGVEKRASIRNFLGLVYILNQDPTQIISTKLSATSRIRRPIPAQTQVV
jgi:hypothetical protein